MLVAIINKAANYQNFFLKKFYFSLKVTQGRHKAPVN